MSQPCLLYFGAGAAYLSGIRCNLHVCLLHSVTITPYHYLLNLLDKLSLGKYFAFVTLEMIASI